MTSSPRRSSGVEADTETQQPAVDEPVTTSADAPETVVGDRGPDAEAVGEPARTDRDAEDPVVAAPQHDDFDPGPVTDPHGAPPIAVDEVSAPPADAAAPVVAGAVTESAPSTSSQRIRPAVRRTGKVRKARLRLLRVEPWSVMKSAFVLSIAIGITFVVAVATLWSIVDAAGVFQIVGDLVTDLTESESATGLAIDDYVGFSRVVGLATVIAVVDVVLLTALATLFAFLYNLSAALLGGFEITLAEDD